MMKRKNAKNQCTQTISALTISIQNCKRHPIQCSKKEKERHKNWKGEIRVSLFTYDIIMYMENLKEHIYY